MSAKPSDDVQTSLRWVSRCKGSEKNVYVQEKFTFFVIGYIFFCSFEDMVPSKYYIFFIPASTYTKKSPFMSENTNGNLMSYTEIGLLIK